MSHDDDDEGPEQPWISLGFFLDNWWDVVRSGTATAASVSALTGGDPWFSIGLLAGSGATAVFDLRDEAAFKAATHGLLRQFGLASDESAAPLRLSYMAEYAALFALVAGQLFMPETVSGFFSVPGNGLALAGLAWANFFLRSFRGKDPDADWRPFVVSRTWLHSDRLALAATTSMLALA